MVGNLVKVVEDEEMEGKPGEKEWQIDDMQMKKKRKIQ